MALIEIDPQTCKKDGSCAAVCPANLFNYTKGELPSPVDGVGSFCIRCGHCVAICRSGSLQHADIPVELCPTIKDELRISAEQSEQFLRSRRSIRNYRDKEVSLDTLQKLIEISRYAPTGHNSQTVEWLVLTDRDELKRLVAIVGDWMRWMLANMNAVALSFHLDSALQRLESGEDVVLRDAPTLIIAHGSMDDSMAPTSCTIALTHLDLAANGLGLGGCWAGYFNVAATSFPPMMASLDLPEGHKCYGAMMIGYPKYRYHRLPERKAPSITWR